MSATPLGPSPAISVLMPVYNGVSYLGEAIESVLAQTLTDFELIIINDGSRDGSEALIAGYRDPRIRYYSQPNQGLAATLNRAIGLARGSLLARHDQDDVSLPERFRKQAEFMAGNPDVALVGTHAAIMTAEGRCTGRHHRHPADHALLQFLLLFDNPFVHSSVMLRASALASVGGYTTDRSRQPPEDYELWSRLVRSHRVANLPEPLVRYREVGTGMSRDANNPWLTRLMAISRENLAFASGRGVDEPVVAAATELAHHECYLRRPGYRPGASLRQVAALVRSAAAAIARTIPEDGHARRRRRALRRMVRRYLLLMILRYGYYRARGPLPPPSGAG